MLLLDCWVFDLLAPGRRRKAGVYLCRQEEGETLGVTLDEHGCRVRIVGAGCYQAGNLLNYEIVVSGRESAPLLATYETRVLIVPGGEPLFVPITALRTDMPIAVPTERGNEIARVRSCKRASASPYWDAGPTTVKLVLSQGRTLACVSGICRL